MDYKNKSSNLTHYYYTGIIIASIIIGSYTTKEYIVKHNYTPETEYNNLTIKQLDSIKHKRDSIVNKILEHDTM